MARHSAKDAPVGVYGLDDWRGSIRYYSGRRLIILHSEGELRQFLGRYPDAFALMLAKDFRGFKANGVPLRAMGGRRAIVGRTGKFIRKQLWGRVVVTTSRGVAEGLVADNSVDVDIADQK